MLDNQVKAWVTRINKMNIKPEEAARVGELLGEGPWLDQRHEVLSEALASKMDGAAAGNQARARRPLQTLTCFAAYLTESDCQILSDPDVRNVNKVQRLVAKCVKLGLHLPRETTTKQIIKTAIDCALDALQVAQSVCGAVTLPLSISLLICQCALGDFSWKQCLCSRRHESGRRSRHLENCEQVQAAVEEQNQAHGEEVFASDVS